jgi:hypothetical protein
LRRHASHKPSFHESVGANEPDDQILKENFPEDKKIDLENPITQLLYHSEYKIHKEEVNSKIKEKFQIQTMNLDNLANTNSVVNRDPVRRLSNSSRRSTHAYDSPHQVSEPL